MAKKNSQAVRVVLLDSAKDGRSLYYNRPQLVGLTVKEAIVRLDWGSRSQGRLPHDLQTWAPYYLNEQKVNETNLTVLKAGDVLKCYDP